jgi:hypothetical protein
MSQDVQDGLNPYLGFGPSDFLGSFGSGLCSRSGTRRNAGEDHARSAGAALGPRLAADRHRFPVQHLAVGHPIPLVPVALVVLIPSDSSFPLRDVHSIVRP